MEILEAKKRIDDIHWHIRMQYEYLKFILHQRAILAKEEIMQISWSIANKKDYAFAEKIYQLYSEVMLFHDKEVLNHMKKLGFSDASLRWMISLSDIETEFNKIEANGFTITKAQVLAIIYVYLDIQVKNVVQFETDIYVLHDETRWNFATKEIYEVFRRKDDAIKKGRSPQDEYTLAMLQEIESIKRRKLSRNRG